MTMSFDGCTLRVEARTAADGITLERLRRKLGEYHERHHVVPVGDSLVLAWEVHPTPVDPRFLPQSERA